MCAAEVRGLGSGSPHSSFRIRISTNAHSRGLVRAMFKAIIDVSVTAIIILGTIGVIHVGYTAQHGTIDDPSLPHGDLWRALYSLSA